MGIPEGYLGMRIEEGIKRTSRKEKERGEREEERGRKRVWDKV